MANNSIALRTEGPDFANSFNKGQEAAQGRQLNSLRMQGAQQDMQQSQEEHGRKEALELMGMLGSAGMYALGGKIDGQADPAKWDEAMDGLAQFGLDSAKYKGQPGLASILVNASLTATDRIKMAKDDRDFGLALQELDQKLAANTDTGLTVSYGRDKDGNLVPLQATKDGRMVQSEMPDGVSLDLGVKTEEGAAGTARGKARVEAQVALPGVSSIAGLVGDQVKSLKEDPHLPSMLGPLDSRLPNVTEDAARVQSKMDQLQGGAFLQARQMLKGGGAITDYEGKKAEAAFVRMNAAQSVKDFNAALDEFDSAVKQGLAKLERQAAEPANNRSGAEKRVEDMTDAELEALANGQ